MIKVNLFIILELSVSIKYLICVIVFENGKKIMENYILKFQDKTAKICNVTGN